MFWPNKKITTIKVKFLEAGKDKPFAISMVPTEQLPDAFEKNTTIEITQKRWLVVDAVPRFRNQYELQYRR